MKNSIIIKTELDSETRVEICIRVIEEPRLPTPNELETSRGPSIVEFQEISERLKTLDRLSIEVADWPPLPKQLPPEELAEAIATAILTCGTVDDSEECERVQLMKRQPDGTEENLGGLNKPNLIRDITDIIIENLP